MCGFFLTRITCLSIVSDQEPSSQKSKALIWTRIKTRISKKGRNNPEQPTSPKRSTANFPAHANVHVSACTLESNRKHYPVLGGFNVVVYKCTC